MPNDKKFNSKYASDEYSNMSEEDLENAGFSVVKPGPATQAIEEKLRQITEQRRTKNRNNKNKGIKRKPNFSQLVTRTRERLNRPPLINSDPDTTFTPWSSPSSYKNSPLPMEQRIERNIVVPDLEIVHPGTNRTNERYRENVQNRFKIQAAGAHVDQVLREEYPCHVCGGKPNGGKPLMPWWKKNQQEFCEGCMNHGYVLTRECRSCNGSGNIQKHDCIQCKGDPDCSYCGGHGKTTKCDFGMESCDGTGKIATGETPFEFFSDLHKKYGAYNRAVFDHVENCTPWACAYGCELNKTGAIDRLRMAAENAGKSLRNRDAWKVTHPVPGATLNTLDLTAPYAINDQLKPLSPIFSWIGGREGSPIGFGDAVIFTNHDTTNPTADFSQGKDPHYVQPGFKTFHPPSDGSGPISLPRPARSNYRSDEEHAEAFKNWEHDNAQHVRKQTEEYWRESPLRQSLLREDESLSRGFRSKGQRGFVVHASKDGTKVWAVVLGNSLKDIRDERNERLKNNRREATCDTCDGKGEIFGKNDKGKPIFRNCPTCDGDGVIEKGLDRSMLMNNNETFDTTTYDDESSNDREKKNKTIGRIQTRWEGVVNYIGERSPIEISPSSVKVSLVKATPDQFTRLTDANAAQFMTIGHFAARRSGKNENRSGTESFFNDTVTPLLGGGNRPNQTLIYNVLNRKGHGLDTESMQNWMVNTDNNAARKWAFKATKVIDKLRGLRPGDEGAITPVMLGGHLEEYQPPQAQESKAVGSRGISINGPSRGTRSLLGRGTEIAGPPVDEEPDTHNATRALTSMENAYFGNCRPGCAIKHEHIDKEFDTDQAAEALIRLEAYGYNVGKALNDMDNERFELPPQGDSNE
jgi:hypothetical protein